MSRSLHSGSFWTGIAAFLMILAPSTGQAAASQPLFAKSHALVVGVGRYESNVWPSLDYAKKDARAVASFLKKQGYEVRMLLDSQATRVRILRELTDYMATRLGPDDRVVLFFSGHGETKERSGRDIGYVIPYDGGDETGNWISMAELQDISRQMDIARHQLFIFDSCYGGEFAVKGVLSSIRDDHPHYIQKISENKARQFITAGGKGERVRADGPDGYSYFTGYLLKALGGTADLNGDSYVTTSELHAFLEPAASNWDHTPIAGTMSGHEQGNFWFRASSSDDSDGTRPSKGLLSGLFGQSWKGPGETPSSSDPKAATVSVLRTTSDAADEAHKRSESCRASEELIAIRGIERRTQTHLHRLGYCTLEDIEMLSSEDMAIIKRELPWTEGSIDGTIENYVPWADQAAAIRAGNPLFTD